MGPCVVPACVTYQCVTGATSQCSVTCGSGTTTTTRTCMAYSGGGQTPVNNYLGNPAAAQQCGNCQSTSAPCILCPNYVAQPPPYIAPPPYVAPKVGCVGGIQQISGAQALAAKLVVGIAGVQADIKGPAAAFGGFCSSFGLSDGIVLTTGLTTGINTPFTATSQGHDHSPAGENGDRAELCLKFTASAASTLSFRFVFASQVTPRYFGSNYNDDFKILVDGQNVAMLPNGKEVTINNLGTNKDNKATWSDQFILNQPTQPGAPAGMTGYTKVQTASKAISAGAHDLCFMVKDKYDGRMDSAVFIEGGSVKLTRRSATKEEKKIEQTEAATDSDFSAGFMLISLVCGAIVIVGMSAGIWTVAHKRGVMSVTRDVAAVNDMSCQTD